MRTLVRNLAVGGLLWVAGCKHEERQVVSIQPSDCTPDAATIDRVWIFIAIGMANGAEMNTLTT